MLLSHSACSDAYCRAQPPHGTVQRVSMQDGCADPLDVWQEVDVEWKLRLKLCCIDVLAVAPAAAASPQPQACRRRCGRRRPQSRCYRCARRTRRAPGTHHPHLCGAVGYQTWTALSIYLQGLSQQSWPALDTAGPLQTPDCCKPTVCGEPHTFGTPLLVPQCAAPMYSFLAGPCRIHEARCTLYGFLMHGLHHNDSQALPA